MMKFSHLADCHIGSYRDERMSALTIEAFRKAVETSIKEKVDFMLISGDLFNTSIPSIDSIKNTVSLLRKLYMENIPVYIIAGSHDFSPSGKTMLDVLENAGLCSNIAKGNMDSSGKLQLSFTEDQNTGAKITGIVGRRGSLEKSYYESLDNSSIEEATGFKIFMFHSAITELKPKGMEKIESSPISYLPKNFNYYAGGHVHSVIKHSSEELGGVVAYPGPLFPNSFKEIEDLEHGGFYIFDSEDPELLRFVPVKVKDILKISIDSTNRSPEETMSILQERVEKEDLTDKIILIRIAGRLSSGKVSDVKLGDTINMMYGRGAFFIMRNTASLTSESFEEMRPNSESLANIEEEIIEKNTGQMRFSKIGMNDEKTTVRNLVEMLDIEKQEGETNKDFEERIIENAAFLDKLSDKSEE